MKRRFLAGLAFGAGFSISFLVVWMLGAMLVTPLMMRLSSHEMMVPGPESRVSSSPASTSTSTSTSTSVLQPMTPNFHELPLEEQIKHASVIALAQYEPSPDGRQRAIIKEILKQTPGTTFYYKVGDEYADMPTPSRTVPCGN